jgi:hypothetical protein
LSLASGIRYFGGCPGIPWPYQQADFFLTYFARGVPFGTRFPKASK